MTARKDQTQPIILKAVLFIGPFRRTPLRFEIAHELILGRTNSCPSTQRINGFEPGSRNQPWSRVAGYSTARPQAQRSGKGFVHRLLGKIKITEQADQSCQDSSRIHAVKGVEQFAYRLGGRLGHEDDLSKASYSESIWQTADVRMLFSTTVNRQSEATPNFPEIFISLLYKEDQTKSRSMFKGNVKKVIDKPRGNLIQQRPLSMET
jgi:hypothetical protein